MKIIDRTDKPDRRSFLQNAWDKLPTHWQTAAEMAVPLGTEIVSPDELINGVNKEEVVWLYRPIDILRGFTSTGMEDLMAFLRGTTEGNQVWCSWRFKVKFGVPSFYFQKHFLRTLAVAVYLQKEDLRQAVSEESRFEKDSVEAELFFGDTFYKWCLYNRELAEDRYGSALACFDRIDSRAKEILR